VAAAVVGLTFATGLRSIAHGAPGTTGSAIAAATVLSVGVLRWPMIPVVLCLGPLSIGLAWLQARRR
jgi:chromate transporter